MPAKSPLDLRPPATERILPAVLGRRVAEMPEKLWFICRDERVTFAEADRRSDACAAGLREAGLHGKATVLVLLPNSAEFVIIWVALAKAGAIMVPLNTALRGNPLVHQINDSDADWIIIDALHLAKLEEQAANIARCRNVVVLNAESDEAVRRQFPNFCKDRRLYSYSGIANSAAGLSAPRPAHKDVAALMYTSGTTGMSKGVVIYHAHAFEYSKHSAAAASMREGDVVYIPLPLFHVAGLWAGVYGCAISGATAVIAESFSLSRFWQDVVATGCNVCYLLGAMGSFIYKQAVKTPPPEHLLERALVVPVPTDLKDFATRLHVKVSTAYASTEVGGCVVYHTDIEAAGTSCGRVDESRMELRIVDENDESLPAETVGEIVVRPRVPWTVMGGYWKRPEASLEAWRNLWLHTGDLGTLDSNGNLTFVDRLKDSIRRRGENISSVEVENEILSHPDVLECAVFPVASVDTEQEVMAAVVLMPGRELSAEALITYVAPRMAYFMVPRFVDFVTELPKTETGKISKVQLRARGITRTTWDRQVSGLQIAR
jgi:carnitine-CoA ligase